ncbi:MAG TPA: M20/M25/M40 family metallo-hydrolase [Gemmatimonadaceae bacterium]
MALASRSSLSRSPAARSPLFLAIPALLLALATAPALSAQGTRLSRAERRMRDYIQKHRSEQVDMLARVVDINSGTLNVEGVHRVGAVFRAALDSLGFETRWSEMPASMHRAGHLIAVHRGRDGGTRILLIGHLDTVFEGEGQQFVREDTAARGAGSSDMKGGDVIIIYALKALRAVGALKDANITVVFSGDEEAAGDPLSVSRRDLIEAGKRSDIVLGFEGGSREVATVARRGDSNWLLTVRARQSHSSGIFGDSTGDGAVFEAARILDAMRGQLSHEQYLTFNPGIIVGGTDVTFDSAHVTGAAAGKLNIIAPTVYVQGDLRFLSEEQKANARERMRAIVAEHLPFTSAEIAFGDEYPAMPPTAGNRALLAVYDSASQALGYGAVEALDPGKRGAGDISFVAPYVSGLDGLGADGAGAHSPRERVFLPSIVMQTERAAVVLYRLSRGK